MGFDEGLTHFECTGDFVNYPNDSLTMEVMNVFKVPLFDEKLLEEIGEWLGRCGEAIYGSRITQNYNDGNLWFSAGKDCRTLYAVYALPDGEALPAILEWTGNLPRGKVTLLNSGKTIKATVKDGKVTLKLPKNLPQEPIALKFEL